MIGCKKRASIVKFAGDMGKIKNIVFDFGGVFIDWNQHYLYDKYFSTQEESDWFCSNVCNREWCEMTDSGIGMPEATRRRIALFPQYADAINTWTERFLETCNGIVPGMLDLVLELKRKGYHLYGLTNWASETCALTRKTYHEIFDPLEGIVVSADVKVTKPNPRIYQILLERFALKAEESVFIDDAQRNVDGAKAVGMEALLFEGAGKLRADLSRLLQEPLQ